MHLLLLSIGALFVAPALRFLPDRMWTVLNLLAKLAVFSGVFLHIMPESFEVCGWIAIVALIVGFIFPTLAESYWVKQAATIHRGAIAVIVIGLFGHGILDGAALIIGHDSHSHVLPWLVIVHRIPVSFLIWSTLNSQLYRWLGLAILSSSSVIGFFLGHNWFELLDHSSSFNLLQAFVSGSLLHVLKGHGDHAADHEPRSV